MNVHRILLLCLSAVCFAVSAAGQQKILRAGNGDEPQDLDPQVISGSVEHRLACALFEGLVNNSPDDLGVIPGVAERWDVSDDGLVYTFHLRADAKWSNGEPVTANDFVRSYARMLSPKLATEYAYMLFLLKGATDYYTGKTGNFSTVGARAPDERTLVLTLERPAPFFLSALTHYAWFPVPLSVIEKFGPVDAKGSRWTRPGNLVGNGPFVLTEWKQNQIISTRRSPTYWDRETVKLDGIDFYPVTQSDNEERMYRAGQLDITYDFPPQKIPSYKRSPDSHLRIDPYCGVYFYRFNTKRKPFDDVRVRRAFALAINRERLVKYVTLADEKPAYTIVPPDVAGYTPAPDAALKANIAEARRLLAEAGYPNGKGFPKTELLYNTLEKHRIIAEALQQMWRKNLGVEIGLYNQEWKVYLDSQKTMNFQVQRAGWIADYVDPHVFFDLWRTGGGNNNTNWGNAEYDRMLDAALEAKTQEERYAIYQRMEKMLLRDLPIMPIYFYTYARIISPRVKNFRTTFLDNYPWKYVDLEVK
ncbi:oligopeptide transport system substrate-binding protein [Ereboglobus sp. PH5-10]|uniref:peptide ABC transporter substrate-binding protein n=1 Tax=Ereboglobus sp. PH5-10 TaxID=2940629 RepID=UPI0024068A0B|nr:peptide ABC transporter substrate-binding protein [Ereboglobus sp. PH5-10]MDF9826037.1 oligopeptide transport system substrate-binding protein [Ereboglobus sp. PH5-10]